MLSAGEGVQSCQKEMVFRPRGSFRPGSTDGSSDERPPNFPITISAHCTDVHEFTYGDLARVREKLSEMIQGTKRLCAADNNSSGIKQICRLLNVTSISVDDLPKPPKDYNPNMPLAADWFTAVKLCRIQGKRLPTEMEWEYDAIGNSGAPYAVAEWSRELNSGLAVYNAGGPAQVCSKPKTPIGLCDMAGNRWEWVADWYREDEYNRMGSHDPKGPDKGDYKVLRGGSWSYSARFLRASFRYSGAGPGVSHFDFGFRCVSSPEHFPRALPMRSKEL